MISDTITGTDNLTQRGISTLTLTSLTSFGYYYGATTVNEGMLKFINPGVLDSNAITIVTSL